MPEEGIPHVRPLDELGIKIPDLLEEPLESRNATGLLVTMSRTQLGRLRVDAKRPGGTIHRHQVVQGVKCAHGIDDTASLASADEVFVRYIAQQLKNKGFEVGIIEREGKPPHLSVAHTEEDPLTAVEIIRKECIAIREESQLDGLAMTFSANGDNPVVFQFGWVLPDKQKKSTS